jgi:hypothetical protein
MKICKISDRVIHVSDQRLFDPLSYYFARGLNLFADVWKSHHGCRLVIAKEIS